MVGVAFNAPPAGLIPDIGASITQALASLEPGKNGAVVTLVTEAGVNAAIVARHGDTWSVQAWVGKEWGGAFYGGAAIKASW